MSQKLVATWIKRHAWVCLSELGIFTQQKAKAVIQTVIQTEFFLK